MSLRKLLMGLSTGLVACATAPAAPPPVAGATIIAAGNSGESCQVSEARAPLALEAPTDLLQPPTDAVAGPAGLMMRVLSPGCGNRRPGTFSAVRVHYAGWTQDGKMFDSSIPRGEPSTFTLNAVIPGWREGVKQMVVGERRRLWVPEELAYKGQPGPQGPLVFDVELVELVSR